MIVVMKADASLEQVEAIKSRISEEGLRPSTVEGSERTIVGVLGSITRDHETALERMPGVLQILRVSRPYKLASREFHPEDTVVQVGEVRVGGGDLAVMAGPCSVESKEQVVKTALAVKTAGANMLRGGAFKPRTSPYSFRGLGVEGLEYLAAAREETGLPVITEVMTVEDLPAVSEFSDVVQVGARNMQNFNLLDAVGQQSKPVMVKRGLSATIEEWLLAAEYILNQGNPNVILCERGIRTFETATRNTLDISAVPLVQKLSHLPIVSDPSHGTGKWYLVQAMADASVAAVADGLMVELHPEPDHAKSDGAQSLTVPNFGIHMDQVRALSKVVASDGPVGARAQ